MKRRQLIEQKRKLIMSGINFKLMYNDCTRFNNPYWHNQLLASYYNTLTLLHVVWGSSNIVPFHELKNSIILMKRFERTRLPMQKPSRLHGIPKIGSPNPSKLLGKGNASTMNHKLFMANKFAFRLSLLFFTLFPSSN